MSTDYSIKMTLGYSGTDFERDWTVKGVDSVSAATETVRSKVQAVNASLEGGRDGGLSNFFRADDFNQSEGVGNLNQIKKVVIKRDDETFLIGGDN